MKELRIRFIGVTPLLLHNGRMADPLYPHARELKKVAQKKKKTESDFAEMARIEWYGGLYLNEKGRIIIPTEMVEAALKDSAKRDRKGKSVDKALVCRDTTPLDIGNNYKNIDELWHDEKYRLTCIVRIGKNRVVRTRPKFDQWSFTAKVEYDEYVLEQSDIESFIKGICFGDWRPKFGQAQGEIIK